MKKTHIREFCEGRSQSEAAAIIGCTQAAVSQMLKKGRDVYIVINDDGSQTWEEIRKPKAKAA